MTESERTVTDLPASHRTALPGLHFHLPLDPARLLRARHRIRDYLHACAADPAAVEDVVLAIQEAMTNAVAHSGAREDLEVDIEFSGVDLVAQIRDRGAGFDIAGFDPGRRPSLDEPRGRGLYLMAQLMDEVALSAGDGLTVKAVKRAALSGASAPPPVAHVHQDSRRLALLEEIDEGFFALDWEYRYRQVNAALEAIYDTPREALLGAPCWDAFPGLRDQAPGEALRQAMELGRSAILEYVSPTIGRWLELRVYPTASGVSGYLRVIEERKRKELERDELLAALRESRADLDRAQAVGQIGSWRLDIHSDVFHWSAEMYRIFGVPAGTPVTYQRLLAQVHRDDRRRLEEAWAAALEGAPYDLEHRVVVGGEVKWVREKAFLERGPDGAVTGGFGIAQDVTARKRLEEELIRREEQARLLLQKAPAAIFEVDLRGPRLRTVNHFLCEYSGYSREELLAMNPLALLAADDRPRFTERIRRRLAGEELPPSVECGFLTKLGESRRAVLTITPTLEGDSVTGAFIVAQDVTERSRAEEALRRSERRYRELVDNANSAIIRWTRDGTLTFFNEAAEKLFGWRADEIVGRHVGVLVPERDVSGADLTGLVEAIVRHPERYRDNLNENICRDGRRIWITWTNSPIYDERGEVVEILAVGNDVTQRRQTERALHESEERFRLALRNAPVTVAVQDRDLKFVWAYNQQTATPDQIIGKTDADLFTPEEAERLVAIKRRVLDEGIEVRKNMWFDRPSGRLFLDVSFAPIRDEAGGITGVGIATVDMTRMKQAEEALRESLAERIRLADQQASQARRLAVLAELAKAAGSALDLDELAPRLTAEVVQLLDASDVSLAAADQATGELRLLARARSAGSAAAGEPTTLQDDDLLARVFHTGDPLLLRGRPAGRAALETDGEQPAPGATSFAALPLAIKGQPIGALGIGWPDARDFDADEASLLESVAAEIAVGLENARLYEAQRRVAATLQEHLVHPLPTIAGLDLAVLSLPANRPELIGGDFHDVFPIAEGRVVALIGDVMGKGVRAAGLTETVRSAVRALALVTSSPGEILTLVNRLLLGSGSDQFVTALVAVVDQRGGRGRVASAGHPPPLMAGGAASRLVEPEYGPPLGTLPASYSESELEVGPDDTLVLYTDGITEAYRDRDGELFGEERLLDAVRDAEALDPRELVERLREAVVDFAGTLRDDADIVALRRARP
jgi:PAS domain S-box-containing protein